LTVPVHRRTLELVFLYVEAAFGARSTVKTAGRLAGASLALAMMCMLAAPSFAFAQRAPGFRGGAPVVGGANLGVSRSVAVPFPGRGPVVGGSTLGVGRSVAVPFPPHHFGPRPPFRPSFPIAVVGGVPAVVYAAPPSDQAYYPPDYYPPAYYPPAYYDPSMSYAPPSGTVSFAPDPSQKIVQFPTGRYEMRGDGVSSPYTWVWIPNPPTSPPPAAPTEPPAAPTAQPAAEPGSSSPPSAARISRLYRWTDEQGSVHWTDRLDAVPEQYRSRVKQTSPS
jgi:hypothetical protein